MIVACGLNTNVIALPLGIGIKSTQFPCGKGGEDHEETTILVQVLVFFIQVVLISRCTVVEESEVQDAN